MAKKWQMRCSAVESQPIGMSVAVHHLPLRCTVFSFVTWNLRYCYKSCPGISHNSFLRSSRGLNTGMVQERRRNIQSIHRSYANNPKKGTVVIHDRMPKARIAETAMVTHLYSSLGARLHRGYRVHGMAARIYSLPTLYIQCKGTA